MPRTSEQYVSHGDNVKGTLGLIIADQSDAENVPTPGCQARHLLWRELACGTSRGVLWQNQGIRFLHTALPPLHMCSPVFPVQLQFWRGPPAWWSGQGTLAGAQLAYCPEKCYYLLLVSSHLTAWWKCAHQTAEKQNIAHGTQWPSTR